MPLKILGLNHTTAPVDIREQVIYTGDAISRALAEIVTLRGVGGRPHLKALGNSAGGKAIWVIVGDNAVVENIEFSGAKVRGRNGAGTMIKSKCPCEPNSAISCRLRMVMLGGEPGRSRT